MKLMFMWFDRLVTLHTHTKFRLNWTNGFWDTKQRKIWPLTFICIAKMASYQLDGIMIYFCLITLHMHTKSGLNGTQGYWDTKQRKIWHLTFICITKMASYQVDVFMWFDRLVTLHMHTKFRLTWTNGSWDTIQRECVCGRMCVCVCVCVCVCDIRKRHWHVMPWSHLCVKPSGMSNANVWLCMAHRRRL